MPALISLLYGVAAVFGAAFAVVELRMLYRFLTNRTAIRAGASAHGQDRDPEGAAQEDIAPTVTVQIPLYNERTSAEQIIRAAAALDYPQDRPDIQVPDDSTDETSEIAAAVERRDAGDSRVLFGADRALPRRCAQAFRRVSGA